MGDVGAIELREARAHAYENARPEIQRRVPHAARRILDLGCSSGALGAALKSDREPAPEIVGVELDPVYAKRAAARLDLVIEADIERLAFDEPGLLELGEFDCLIAGDVLEHLVDPWACLARTAARLRQGGTAVVSVPNIRYWETFWQLLRGTFPQRSAGIFDRDHLRWFTVGDAVALVEQAGLRVEAVDRQYRLRPATPGPPWFASIVERTPLRPFFTFQVVVAARRVQ